MASVRIKETKMDTISHAFSVTDRRVKFNLAIYLRSFQHRLQEDIQHNLTNFVAGAFVVSLTTLVHKIKGVHADN